MGIRRLLWQRLSAGGVLGVDGRSQDTPFFQHMMPKNQLDETHSARPPPQSVAVVRGERTAAEKRGSVQNFKRKSEDACWWFASLVC